MIISFKLLEVSRCVWRLCCMAAASSEFPTETRPLALLRLGLFAKDLLCNLLFFDPVMPDASSTSLLGLVNTLAKLSLNHSLSVEIM